MRGGLAENLGGSKRRAITEDVKDKRKRGVQGIWERMDAKEKSVIRISVFGTNIVERVSAGAKRSCEMKSDGLADREQK